jgi:lipid A 3-O-deacylase
LSTQRPRLLLLLFALFSPVFALAQAPCPEVQSIGARGLYTFLWENDYLGGSDENYTNGNRIAYTSHPQSIEGIHGKLASKLLGADCHADVLFGVALGQSMYTPERDSLEQTALLKDQHPYAGWAYAEYSLAVGRSAYKEKKTDWQLLSLQVGVVGPLARQQQMQDTFHDWIDDEHFLGWDQQIGNEPALLLSYERRWQQAARRLQGSPLLMADLIPNVGVGVGNVLSQVSGGLTARVGSGLGEVDLPTRIHPAASGMGLFTRDERLRWYVYASVEGRLVAHNIFLDGNTLKESARVEKNFAVYDRLLGVSLQKKRRQFTVTLVERSEEFVLQKGPHRFGSMSISVLY